MLYQNGSYKVEVAQDGTIHVNQGDWLSKYSYAIYKNYTTLDKFARRDPSGQPTPIVNKNLIITGELLLHLDTYYNWLNNGGAPSGGDPAERPAAWPGRPAATPPDRRAPR